MLNMNKKKVVMADGVFDPIHDGHIAYLEAAGALGTYLIVNVASDKEIWQKRPSLGPFLPFAVRIAVIKALKPVHEVTFLDTAEALQKFKPDIYVKGADWKGGIPQIESQICQSLGIQICFVNTVSNSSTLLLQNFLDQVNRTH